MKMLHATSSLPKQPPHPPQPYKLYSLTPLFVIDPRTALEDHPDLRCPKLRNFKLKCRCQCSRMQGMEAATIVNEGTPGANLVFEVPTPKTQFDELASPGLNPGLKAPEPSIPIPRQHFDVANGEMQAARQYIQATEQDAATNAQDTAINEMEVATNELRAANNELEAAINDPGAANNEQQEFKAAVQQAQLVFNRYPIERVSMEKVLNSGFYQEEVQRFLVIRVETMNRFLAAKRDSKLSDDEFNLCLKLWNSSEDILKMLG
jgi:hypothetical protein